MNGELAIEVHCKAANLDDARAQLERQGRQWFGDTWGRHCKYKVAITDVQPGDVDRTVSGGEVSRTFDVTGIAGREDHVERATDRGTP